MTSRICRTSWSLSWLTRRSAGILTFSMISEAFFWPMPWIYWSAISTRLLVGIFTPAIRATDFSPVTGQVQAGIFIVSGCVRKREHDARPLGCLGGSASLENYPTGCGLLKDSNSFRQPSLSLSSPFHDFFADFLGDLRAPAFELDRALGAG